MKKVITIANSYTKLCAHRSPETLAWPHAPTNSEATTTIRLLIALCNKAATQHNAPPPPLFWLVLLHKYAHWRARASAHSKGFADECIVWNECRSRAANIPKAICEADNERVSPMVTTLEYLNFGQTSLARSETQYWTWKVSFMREVVAINCTEWTQVGFFFVVVVVVFDRVKCEWSIRTNIACETQHDHRKCPVFVAGPDDESAARRALHILSLNDASMICV